MCGYTDRRGQNTDNFCPLSCDSAIHGQFLDTVACSFLNSAPFRVRGGALESSQRPLQNDDGSVAGFVGETADMVLEFDAGRLFYRVHWESLFFWGVSL